LGAQTPAQVAQAGTVRALDATHDLASTRDLRGDKPMMVGAFLGDSVTTVSRVDSAMRAYRAHYGVLPRIVRFYTSLDAPIERESGVGALLREAAEKGSLPMLVLEPTWRTSPTKNLLQAIAKGAADSLVGARTRELAALKLPTLYVELASEMNGRFGALWQPDSNASAKIADAPAEYRAAYRRMVLVARANDARAIHWVWAPVAGNAYTHDDSGAKHWNYAGNYYPGDDVVDVIGLHLFNDPISQGAWIPFVELIDGAASDHSLSRLTAAHPSKPVMVSEFGTDEYPGRANGKAEWIAEMFRQAESCKSIVGLIWFDTNKERDWRIASSAPSAAAFATGAKDAVRADRTN